MPERRGGAGEARSELVPLVRLAAGRAGRLSGRDLAQGEACLLAAMGLVEGCRLVVRASGDPYIVEVRSTRIGLARRLAERVLVRVDAEGAP
jgi:Fe2+ transport system protein FeoA